MMFSKKKKLLFRKKIILIKKSRKKQELDMDLIIMGKIKNGMSLNIKKKQH